MDYIERVDLGDATVYGIIDAEMRMPYAAFPAAPRPTIPPDLAQKYPGEFDSDSWRFLVRLFLIHRSDGVILIDAGVGPEGSPLAAYMGRPGRLQRALAQIGLTFEQIDHVVVTHGHDDHVGWLAKTADGGSYFPNAKLHIHARELAQGMAEHADSHYRDEIFVPLAQNTARVSRDAGYEVAPGVSVVPTPGHTVGHTAIRLRGETGTVWFSGDLVHFTYQLEAPHISGPFDADPAAAQSARVQFLEQADQALIASAHLPNAFTPFGLTTHDHAAH